MSINNNVIRLPLRTIDNVVWIYVHKIKITEQKEFK